VWSVEDMMNSDCFEMRDVTDDIDNNERYHERVREGACPNCNHWSQDIHPFNTSSSIKPGLSVCCVFCGFIKATLIEPAEPKDVTMGSFVIGPRGLV